MENKKVFMVHFPDSLEEVEFIQGVFDNLEDAEAFSKRFKENNEFQITEKQLNPVYSSNKKLSPFDIRFIEDDFEPEDTFIADFLIGLDDEGIDEIKVYFKEGTDKPYSFQQTVYASNLEEATAIVRKNRDDFLKHGKLENANVRVVNEE